MSWVSSWLGGNALGSLGLNDSREARWCGRARSELAGELVGERSDPTLPAHPPPWPPQGGTTPRHCRTHRLRLPDTTSCKPGPAGDDCASATSQAANTHRRDGVRRTQAALRVRACACGCACHPRALTDSLRVPVRRQPRGAEPTEVCRPITHPHITATQHAMCPRRRCNRRGPAMPSS